VWSCETGCSCEGNEKYLADDGCNGCSCDPDLGGFFCTEGGCDARCPIPDLDVVCFDNPIWARATYTAHEPCCRFACAAAAPADWSVHASLGECEGSCANGFGDCNGDPTDGCETSLSDPNNCGSCGHVCAYPHAGAECLDFTCRLASCDSGYGDCDGANSDGCEVDLTSDPNHCWACGRSCPSINGAGVCFEGECAISCSAGYDDCNGDAADGCEVEIESDPNNCGNCGDVCQGPSPVCVGGSCGIE
jgi:hypothetical protein